MSINITIEDAIRSIVYRAKVGVSTTENTSAAWILKEPDNYSSLEWTDIEIPKPTEEEVNAERERLDKEHNYKEYRSQEYPTVEEQLDMLWHSMNAGEIPKCEAFYEKISEVKDNYIKPSMEIVNGHEDVLGDGLVFEENPGITGLTEEDYFKMLEES